MSVNAVSPSIQYPNIQQWLSKATPTTPAQPGTQQSDPIILQSAPTLPESYGRAQVAIQTPLPEGAVKAAKAAQEALDAFENDISPEEKDAIDKALDNSDLGPLKSAIAKLAEKDPKYKNLKDVIDILVENSKLVEAQKTGKITMSDITSIASIFDNEFFTANAPKESESIQIVFKATIESLKRAQEFYMKRATSNEFTTDRKSVGTNLRTVEGILFKDEAELNSQAQELIANGQNPTLVRCAKSEALYLRVFSGNKYSPSVKDVLNLQMMQDNKPIDYAKLAESEAFYTGIASANGLYTKSPKLAQHVVDGSILKEIRKQNNNLTPQEVRERAVANLLYNFYEAATDPEQYLSTELPE